MAVIALIEDDPLVRVPLAHGLDQAGFTVVVAGDGLEGLAVLENHEIDVAVVDVVLPGGVDGIDMVRQARRHNPELKVILTSGRSLPPDLMDMAHFVSKPLRLDDLVARVRRVIDDDDRVNGRDVVARARQVIDEFGALSTFYATFRGDQWRRHGDAEGADAWMRILNAVEALQGSDRAATH